MIQIYSPNNTNYEKNGDMTLFPSSCVISVEINGAWSVDLTHPIDSEGRWKYIEENSVLKMPSFNGEQKFRVKSVSKTDTDISLTAEPIFMDSMGDCFLVDVRPTNKTGQEALDIMTAGSKYSGSSNITLVNTAYYQYKNLIEAINGDDENSFLNRWGGEIEFDNFTVKINGQMGEDNGVELRYGKNIPVDGFTYETDMSEVVTRIYPKAYNGHTMTDNGYVDSPLINNYPTVKAVTMAFDDVKMREDAQEGDEDKGITICDTQEELDAALTSRCNDQYAVGVDMPKITVSADMVLLENTEQYQDFEVLERVSLGDTIHCHNSHLGIEYDARVIALKYNPLLDRVESVTIGDPIYNYFTTLTNTVSAAASTASASASASAGSAASAVQVANQAMEKANEALDAVENVPNMAAYISQAGTFQTLSFYKLSTGLFCFYGTISVTFPNSTVEGGANKSVASVDMSQVVTSVLGGECGYMNGDRIPQIVGSGATAQFVILASSAFNGFTAEVPVVIYAK